MTQAQASEKQIAFITKLVSEKKIVDLSFMAKLNNFLDHPELMTKSIASQAIDKLMAMSSKDKAQTTTSESAKPGFYFYKNEVYKVQTSPNSGYNFAKVFTVDGVWVYAKGMVKQLANASKLTLEQAKEYGKLTG